MSFDAWGQRRFVNNFTVSDINLGDIQFSGLIEKTTKGYTGHEHLDETGIIHMNDRIYTSYLGRFLQADPIIQDPFNTQSLNRYTYIGNNPLSANDPTGYWTVDAFMDNGGRQLIGVVISIVVPNLFIAGVLSGAVTGGTKGALIGAFSAVTLGGIGDYYDNIGAASSTGKFLNTGLTAGQFAGKIALHGLVGGASSLGMGGKFGHGFASVGATQASSPAINVIETGGAPARIIVAALVGGTVSSLTGGKFANGALTAAWSRAFNDEKNAASVPEDIQVEQDGFKSINEAARAAGKKFGPIGVTNKQEVEIGLTFLGKDESGNSNWGYLTPGWGPVNSKTVDPSNLFRAYYKAGFSVNGWLHGHFDSNTNFSPTDFSLVWGDAGANKTYLVDRNNNVSFLTKKRINSLWNRAKSSSPHLKTKGLQGFQIAYPRGIRGEDL